MKSDFYTQKVNLYNGIFFKNKNILLSHLDIELTERCNNNCIHCCINLPADDVAAQEKELSTQEVMEILKEAVSLGCMTVRFTGGEPLLRDDFKEIYVFARKIGLRVIIFTNATLISPEHAELFSSIPPLEKIEVSVYGMKKSSYEQVTRNPGSFELAFRGIKLLLENNIAFIVKSAILPPNKNEIDDFEKWALTIPWMDNLPSYSMFFDLRLRREEEKNIIIRKLRLKPEDGLSILLREKEKYLKSMKEFCSKFLSPPTKELFSCGAGVKGGCVDAYGYFYPCLSCKHPQLAYDLKNGCLEDALKKFFPKIRQFVAKNSDYLSRCARCFLKGMCQQCPAKSWSEDGSLDTPVEYYCQIAHTEARFLGLIKNDEVGWKIKDWQKRVAEILGNERRSNNETKKEKVVNSQTVFTAEDKS